MRVIGLDIGGANLKASDGERKSVTLPYAMWQRARELSAQLKDVLAAFDACDALAVTMTGELADCFATKAEGVAFILDAVQAATPGAVHVWQTSGEFVTPDVASEFPLLTAAANWHALATWTGRVAPHGTALLIDVGSTTTDIIPLEEGLPAVVGRTDLHRLLSGELIYTGVRRTPVYAVSGVLPMGAQLCPLAAECFATMNDVYLITGDATEDAQRTDTADGRPATRADALRRLARMLCCDLTDLSDAQLLNAAEFLRQQQLAKLTSSVARIVQAQPSPPQTVVLSGEGEFVARRIIETTGDLSRADVISVSDILGAEHSRSACAYSVARLARERIH